MEGTKSSIPSCVHLINQSCAGGSIFLIKGPPSAGKTALMSELSRHAEAIGYTIAGNITPSALLDPAAMAKRLGVPYTP